jgi:hypothetical protein
MDARLRYALLLSAALLAAAAIALLYKSGWLRGEQARPDFSAYLRVEEPREQLMDVFRSYDSQPQVTQQLTAAGLQVTVERVHVEGSRKYPPYKLDTLTVRGYRHLDHEGVLLLDFFNDRLSSATFRPAEPKAYLRRLQRAGIRFQREDLSRWAQQTGNLRVSTNIIYATSDVGRTLNTQAYASWEDVRLVAQSREWYVAYGSKYSLSPIRTVGPGTVP